MFASDITCHSIFIYYPFRLSLVYDQAIISASFDYQKPNYIRNLKSFRFYF